MSKNGAPRRPRTPKLPAAPWGFDVALEPTKIDKFLMMVRAGVDLEVAAQAARILPVVLDYWRKVAQAAVKALGHTEALLSEYAGHVQLEDEIAYSAAEAEARLVVVYNNAAMRDGKLARAKLADIAPARWGTRRLRDEDDDAPRVVQQLGTGPTVVAEEKPIRLWLPEEKPLLPARSAGSAADAAPPSGPRTPPTSFVTIEDELDGDFDGDIINTEGSAVG